MNNDESFKDFILIKFKKAKEAEKQWLLSLQNIPNGIMIFDIKNEKVIFENEMMNDLLKD